MHIGLSQPTNPVTVGQSQLEEVDVFQYLGSNIVSDGKVDSDISSRLAKAATGSSMYGCHQQSGCILSCVCIP